MKDEENKSFVKLTVIDGGSAVRAEMQPDGTILFFDEDGNLTKDTIVQKNVYTIDNHHKKKLVTTEYDAQGSLNHLRGHIGDEFIFACDTNTNDKIIINNVECNFSIGVVTQLYQPNERQVAADAIFGICWIWRGKYDIELLSWDVAMQMLTNSLREKCILVTDSQRYNLKAFNNREKCFRSGRCVPDNITLAYSKSKKENTSYNIAMTVCHNTSKNIQNSKFKDELCSGRFKLPKQINVDEAWYAIINLKKVTDSDLINLHISDFMKYNISE